MGTLMNRTKTVERNKRWLFLGVEGLGVAATFALTPWLGVPLMGLGVYFGMDWFKFRAKNGMRF